MVTKIEQMKKSYRELEKEKLIEIIIDLKYKVLRRNQLIRFLKKPPLAL